MPRILRPMTNDKDDTTELMTVNKSVAVTTDRKQDDGTKWGVHERIDYRFRLFFFFSASSLRNRREKRCTECFKLKMTWGKSWEILG